MNKRLTVLSLLLVLVCGGAFAQSWESALTNGFTSVDFSKVGYEYTITVYNMTGILGDPTENYDVLVWTVEPFNLPAPQDILEMPAGWAWEGGGFKMFAIVDDSQKYYTPPALGPGEFYTFKYTSTLLTPANQGGPEDGSAGFLCHIAAVDSSMPGSATEKWIPYEPEGMPRTWYDKSIPVPEPGGLLALASGLLGTLGFIARKRGI